MPIPSSTGTATPNSILLSDIAIRVKRIFGDSANVQITDDDIIRWSNDAMREIVVNNDLLQAVGTTQINVGQTSYTLPLDALTMRSVIYNGRKLRALNVREAEEYINTSDTQSGEPSLFWVWANTINLYPNPDTVAATHTLNIYYTRQPVYAALITDSLEMPLQYMNRIVEYCLQQSYELDENWQASSSKMSQFKDGINKLKDETDWAERDYYPFITSSPDFENGGYGYTLW
jgi:hypothetical protein